MYEIANSFAIITQLILLSVVFRLKYNEIPIWANFIKMLLLLVAVYTFIAAIYTRDSIIFGAYPLAQYFYSISVVITQAIVVYVMITITSIQNNKRVNHSKFLWILSASIWGTAQLIVCSHLLLFQIAIDQLSFIELILIVSLVTIAQVPILINHIIYPEAVLLSYEQLHRARDLYKRITPRGNVLEQYGMVQLRDYLDSIDYNLKKELAIIS
jgi:hypothetical protein